MPSSLDKFAAKNGSTSGYASYMDGLPADVREQVLTSSAGHSVTVKWLHELGYKRATQNIVGNWRRRNGWKA